MLTAGLLLAVIPALPQQGESDASIQKDAAFALALTKQLGFDNFSEIVLEDALQRASSADDRSTVLLARCEVMSTIALKPIDPIEQVDAWSKAGEAYLEFLATDPTGMAERKAQLQMGLVGYQYGERLSGLFDSGMLSQEQKEERIQTAEPILTEALKSTNEVIIWWISIEDQDIKDGFQFTYYFPASFYRALIYFHWGVLYPEGSVEREDYLSQCISKLEEFAIEAGELSPAGLLAFRFMGDALVALGDPEFGVELFDFVILEGVPNNDTSQMSPAEVTRRRDAQQDAFLSKIKAYQKLGRSADIQALGATFQQWVEDNRVKLNGSGYRMQLGLAENLIDQGDFGGAISIAKKVSDENDQSLLRLEADAVLGRAIAAAPETAKIDLQVLFQAGQGAFFSEKYGESAQMLRMLVNRLDNSDTAQEIGGQAYRFLARALEADGLALEAAVAYQAGYTAYSEDEEAAESLASGWQRLAERFRRAAPDDEYLDVFYNEALDAVTESTGGGAPHVLLLRAADSEFNKARGLERDARGKAPNSPEGRAVLTAYDKAIAAYKRVPEGTDSYEKAFVQIGMCEYNKFAWDNGAGKRAIKIFEEYLNVIVPDPTKAPTTPKGKKYRTDSIARADFYRGYTYRQEALAGNNAAWDKMLAAFDGFEERQSDQADQIGAVRTARAEAFLAQGKEADAIAQYELLVADGASEAWLGSCAFKLYDHYRAQADNLADEEAKLEAQKGAVKYLGIVNSNAASQQWPNLLAEARLHLAVGDLKSGSDLLESTIDNYGGKDGFTDTSLLYARLDLVDALLEQGVTGSAVGHVDALLAEAPKMLRVMQAAIKIKCGFPVYRNGRVVQVPGEDTVEAYETANDLLSELRQLAEADARNKGVSRFEHQPWWEARMQYAFLLYKWGRIDSSKSHQKLIESIERQAPDFGAAFVDSSIPAVFRWLKAQG